MNRRRIETVMAWFTVGMLAIYVPVETWVSWPGGLLNPFYLVDAIAMFLMAWGAAHSLRSRPHCAPGVLCAAYAWAGANGWRATFGRMTEFRAGRELTYGAGELWVVGAATAVAITCLLILLVLVVADASAHRD